MSLKPLDSLLCLQGGLCFFCNVPLPRDRATVEHLNARSNGGSNDEDNCVACCKEMNNLLGSRSVKEKLRIVLSHKGRFTCPRLAAPVATALAAKSQPQPPVNAGQNDYAVVLAKLAAMKTSRPKTVAKLKNTIRHTVAAKRGKLSEPQLESLLKRLKNTGKVQFSGDAVSYPA